MLVTVAILTTLETNADAMRELDESEKRILKYSADRFLSTLTAAELEAAVNAVKSLGDKAQISGNGV